jgi:hypothetical protein
MSNDRWHFLIDETLAVEDTQRAPFVEGQVREFAVMVIPTAIPCLRQDEVDVKGDEWRGAHRYWLRGEVVFRNDVFTVIDFGLMVYLFPTAHQLRGIEVGMFVSGDVELTVDDYLYAENGRRIAGIPPLVYTWCVGQYAYGALSCSLLPIPPKYEENPKPKRFLQS